MYTCYFPLRSLSDILVEFGFCLFYVVIRVFSSPQQRPMTSDFEGFLSQILSITFLFISLHTFVLLLLFYYYYLVEIKTDLGMNMQYRYRVNLI